MRVVSRLEVKSKYVIFPLTHCLANSSVTHTMLCIYSIIAFKFWFIFYDNISVLGQPQSVGGVEEQSEVVVEKQAAVDGGSKKRAAQSDVLLLSFYFCL